MKRFVSDLKQHWKRRPFVWTDEGSRSHGGLELPRKARVLVLAPHPDDPESVAITIRLLMKSGCDVRYVIVTLSPSGVQDEDAGPAAHPDVVSLDQRKMAIRRGEQIRAAAALGLTEERIRFLCLGGIGGSVALDSRENRDRITLVLESAMPDIVILPAGKDSNQTHAWVHRVFRGYARRNAQRRRRPLVALCNEDPKTTSMRADLLVLFGEESAEWKRAVLRIHDSQQKRNLRLRQMGFDERILEVSRLRFAQFSRSRDFDLSSTGYAEAFEIERYGFS